MIHKALSSTKNVPYNDLISGLVVFLVALPLCLGVALASNAPLFSGILAGIIGGIVVGAISGSSTSVSGPAAGLTAVVATQIGHLGSFQAFLTAIIIAGVIQVILSICRMGFIAAFFPSSVIKGLLWSIGALLILKQIPHLVGHDVVPLGGDSFIQTDKENTFSELIRTVFHIHPGAALIGVLSTAFLIIWDKIDVLKKSIIPSPLVVIILAILFKFFLEHFGANWSIKATHLVQVPDVSLKDSYQFLTFPDLSILNNFAVYSAAITIAIVASLETLLNLEAVDKIDPHHRVSPPNRELFAQGTGNIIAGFIGGLPLTSVIVRSSVNINAGAKTKLSAIWHGFLILGSVLLVPQWLNQIPLSALAAILFITGLKLASPKIFLQMWNEGKNQFIPFFITIIAIIFTDLLIGLVIGLVTVIGFILHSNLKRPIKKVMEKHATGDEVLHIELPNQVSFFNRASLENTLNTIPRDKHVLIDATNSDYIDADILDLITDFKNNAENTEKVSLVGFKDKYPQLEDRIQYADFSTRERQDLLTSAQVLEILKEGNVRFRQGIRLTRNLEHQLNATFKGQFPMAVILSCIDSRAPVELIFDLSLGDVFTVRVAGNVVSQDILGSIEYGCSVAGAKLILVMGHTSCGAVRTAVDLTGNTQTIEKATGCANLDSLITDIQQSVNDHECKNMNAWTPQQKETFCNDVAYKNVLKNMTKIRQESPTINKLINEGKVDIVGAMYNIHTAQVFFFHPLNFKKDEKKGVKEILRTFMNSLKTP